MCPTKCTNRRKKISEKELVNLSMAVTVINSWNRLNIALRTVPGGYKPAKARETPKRAGAHSQSHAKNLANGARAPILLWLKLPEASHVHPSRQAHDHIAADPRRRGSSSSPRVWISQHVRLQSVSFAG